MKLKLQRLKKEKKNQPKLQHDAHAFFYLHLNYVIYKG
jgi:hypothetical protein